MPLEGRKEHCLVNCWMGCLKWYFNYYVKTGLVGSLKQYFHNYEGQQKNYCFLVSFDIEFLRLVRDS